jgi:hypothetical protein
MSSTQRVEVDLLRVPIRPFGWDVIRRELDPHPWLTVDEHHVPVVLSVHCATEEPGPKAALGGQIRGVEYDDLMLDSHRVILARSPALCPPPVYRGSRSTSRLAITGSDGPLGSGADLSAQRTRGQARPLGASGGALGTAGYGRRRT